MTHWEERIDAATDPALIEEHVARYAFAAPLVEASATWIDLGCGNGVAARRAIDRLPTRTVLVDVSAEATQNAARELGGNAETHVRDLSAAGDLEWLAEVVATAAAPVCITAFEVIEHLEDFDALLRCLVTASEGGADVLASVPNDAYWGTQNPYHRTMWGAPAIEELRSLLPEGTRYGAQYDVMGTWIAPDADAAPGAAEIGRSGTGEVPSQFLLAFGPRAGDAATVARVRIADGAERRRWERQREADLAYYAEQVEILQQRLDEALRAAHGTEEPAA